MKKKYGNWSRRLQTRRRAWMQTCKESWESDREKRKRNSARQLEVSFLQSLWLPQLPLPPPLSPHHLTSTQPTMKMYLC